MKTISFNIDDDIADKIKDDAEKGWMTVSQLMRKTMTERYDNRDVKNAKE